MTDKIYCYPPDYQVLKNKLGIKNSGDLDVVERRLVVDRVAEGAPKGDFDLRRLRAIHRHLFQDIYDWAGEIRLTELSKGGNQFLPRRFIEGGFADIHSRLKAKKYLKKLDAATFALNGVILGDINHAHPFREGNGRTQFLYLEQLAVRAGHPIELSAIPRDAWMEASRSSHMGQYDAMGRCIGLGIAAGKRR